MRSICNKFSDLRDSIDSSVFSYDILILSETWLKSHFSDCELQLRNYDIFRFDRSEGTSDGSRGGGVLIAIRNDISSQHIPVSTNSIEQIFVKLTDLNVIIGAIYLPPNSPKHLYNVHINDINEINLLHENCDFVMVGDYNLPNLNLEYDFTNVPLVRDDQINDFVIKLSNLNFLQHNNTRNVYGNILDFIFSNLNHIQVKVVIKPLVKLDNHHLILHLSFLSIARHTLNKVPKYISYKFKCCDY